MSRYEVALKFTVKGDKREAERIANWYKLRVQLSSFQGTVRSEVVKIE